MKQEIKHTVVFAVGSVAIVGFLVFSAVASAAGPTNVGGKGTHWAFGRGGMHGVFGTVSAISGTTLTLASRGFGPNATATTYTVDASKATVLKNNATSTLAAVAVGDTVAVQGTVSGTAVSATTIRDGMPQRPMGDRGRATSTWQGWQANPAFQGNGQPVVGGTVKAVSGSTITLTNASNATYTVDASGATVTSGNATSTLSSVKVGDQVLVQGTVTGTSVVASSVHDQTAKPLPGEPKRRGIFGTIFGFFQHLFGF